MITFGNTERKILFHLSDGSKFKFNGQKYIVIESGKPTCRNGEPKTDIYIQAANLKEMKEKIEIKISFKQENADFVENKMSAERAEQILGADWKNIIIKAISKKRPRFLLRDLVYKTNKGRTNKGSITLGWKFELLNKPSGDLSEKMPLTYTEIMDVYSGTNIHINKRNALINGKIIKKSGIATHLLMNDSLHSAQEVIDSLIPIEEYVKINPDLYYACKALNYRTFQKKWDGDRPLAVYVDWQVKNDELTPVLKFNNPLVIKGNNVARKLIESLSELGISTTDDIDDSNFSNSNLIYDPTKTINNGS